MAVSVPEGRRVLPVVKRITPNALSNLEVAFLCVLIDVM